jgi:YHS domain-containing protein
VIRFLILRIVFPLMVILVLRAVIVAIAKAFSQAFNVQGPQQPKQAAQAPTGGELKKDPVCGTYVSAGAAVTKRVNGELVHFCSAECRDKYRAT